MLKLKSNIVRFLLSLVFSFLFCQSSNLFCQSSNLFCQSRKGKDIKHISSYLLQQLDSRNGLSNSCVNTIFQDSDNLLWIGTYDGLNVYDGSNFQIFNYSNKELTRSIGNNIIKSIAEDKNKNIWINTNEGISRYDKRSGKFYNYFYKEHQVELRKLIIDSNNGIFCLLRENGRTVSKKYDFQNGTFKTFPFPFTVDEVSDLFFDSNDCLWILNKGVVEVYQHKNNIFNKLAVYKQERGITSLFYLNQKIFFSLGKKLLYEVDPVTLKSRKVAEIPDGIRSMSFYEGHYITAWLSGGYEVYDDKFQRSSQSLKVMQFLQNMLITSFWAANDQNFWIGTDGNGIIKITPNDRNFNTVTNLSNSASLKAVRAFCEIEEEVWVGTKGYGITTLQYDKERQSLKASGKSFIAPAQLENNSVFAIQKVKDNLVLIGTDGSGVTLYDLKYKKFTKWREIEGSNKHIKFGSVYAILQDKDSSIWLATGGYGLIHLKLYRSNNNKWAISFLKQYTQNAIDAGPASNLISSLIAGKGDYLWVGCRNGGLSLFDKNQQKFRTYRAFSYEGGLTHNDILSLYKDKQNRIWVGTSYGLNWINESKALNNNPRFKKLTIENGLPNNSIHGITEDRKGNIWVSTNNGLVRINPVTLALDRFQQSDGLQSNEFSDGAVWKNANGTIFFGGIYGFNYVNPDDIQANSRQVNLLVTDLQLGGELSNEYGQTVLKPGDKSNSKSFTVSRRNDFFEVKVKAIDFQKAEKCQYAYYLQGLDKTWNYSGTYGIISYKNIPPGYYTLKIKWTNGENRWTEETTLLHITVEQYLWLTWQAFLFYFVVIVISTYAFVSYRKSKLAIKHQLALEHRLRVKDEEVHQEQLNFFTNIAHELQTPLTLITGSVERYIHKNNLSTKSDEKDYFLSLIQQQSSRLSYLVNQVLEFRKAQGGHLKSKYSYVDLSNLLSSIAELFVPLKEQKN